MKKTKKILSLIMALSMACTMFVGCGKESKKEAEYEKGTLTETSFSSEFLGLEFNAPEGYAMMTQEMMDQTMEATAELFYEDEDKKVIDYAKLNTVFEMMCQESTTGFPNANIVVEKNKGLDIEKYIEVSKTNLEKTGLDYKSGDLEKDVEFLGQKYNFIQFKVTTQLGDIAQDMYIKRMGDRIVAITISYQQAEPESKDVLMNAFKELESKEE